MKPYGQKRVGYGDDAKVVRAAAFLEAMKSFTCKHEVPIAVKCSACDAEFDAEGGAE